MSDTDQGQDASLPWDGPDEPVKAEPVEAPAEEVTEPASEPRLVIQDRVKTLMDDGSGFKFYQVTYPEYEELKQAHADGLDGFEMVDDKLHFGGYLVRPA